MLNILNSQPLYLISAFCMIYGAKYVDYFSNFGAAVFSYGTICEFPRGFCINKLI